MTESEKKVQCCECRKFRTEDEDGKISWITRSDWYIRKYANVTSHTYCHDCAAPLLIYNKKGT